MQSDRDVAESLLRFMRDPASLIERVAETCVVGDGEMVRKVNVRIVPGELEGDDHMFLDLLQIERGEYVDLELVDNDRIRKLTHDEHRSVSAFLISTRFLTVWASTKVPPGALIEFDQAMTRAHDELKRIPLLSSAEATLVFASHFDGLSRTLRILLEYPGTVVDPELMFGLYRLCKRLVWKYLALVRIENGGRDAPPELAYSYSQEVAEIDLHDALGSSHERRRSRREASRAGEVGDVGAPPDASRGPGAVQARWRAVKRDVRLRLDPTARPTSFRIHIGWAKRTDHYTFSISAVEGHFISRQGILVQQANGSTQLVRDDQPIRWSINTGQGKRVAVFSSGARETRDRIFVGVQNLELPGGSTSHAFRLAWFVLAGLAPFTVLALISTGPFVEIAGVIFALVAVAAFATTPPRGNGVLGAPLTSRFAPPALAVLVIVFVVWLASRDLAATLWLVHLRGVLDFLRPAWEVWRWFGWLPTVSGSILMLGYLNARRNILRRNYLRAINQQFLVSKNFR